MRTNIARQTDGKQVSPARGGGSLYGNDAQPKMLLIWLDFSKSDSIQPKPFLDAPYSWAACRETLQRNYEVVCRRNGFEAFPYISVVFYMPDKYNLDHVKGALNVGLERLNSLEDEYGWARTEYIDVGERQLLFIGSKRWRSCVPYLSLWCLLLRTFMTEEDTNFPPKKYSIVDGNKKAELGFVLENNFEPMNIVEIMIKNYKDIVQGVDPAKVRQEDTTVGISNQVLLVRMICEAEKILPPGRASLYISRCFIPLIKDIAYRFFNGEDIGYINMAMKNIFEDIRKKPITNFTRETTGDLYVGYSYIISRNLRKILKKEGINFK